MSFIPLNGASCLQPPLFLTLTPLGFHSPKRGVMSATSRRNNHEKHSVGFIPLNGASCLQLRGADEVLLSMFHSPKRGVMSATTSKRRLVSATVSFP